MLAAGFASLGYTDGSGFALAAGNAAAPAERLTMLRVIFAVLLLLAYSTAAHAEIAWTGDVDPSDPISWTDETVAYVGREADGSLIVNDGATISSGPTVLGSQSGVFGEVSMSGGGTNWQAHGIVRVGDEGAGQLAIADGAVLKIDSSVEVGLQAGSLGHVHVAGSGSTLESWQALISSGGFSVTSGGRGEIGYRAMVSSVADTEAKVVIDGEGSQLNVEKYLHIGFDGNGSMAISGGADVNCEVGTIGRLSNTKAEVSVSGRGTTWDVRFGLQVGYSQGDGHFLITDGAVVFSRDASIARNIYSSGRVLIDGSGSAWHASYLQLASSGFIPGEINRGIIEVTNGGLFALRDPPLIGAGSIRQSSGGTFAIMGERTSTFLSLFRSVQYWDSAIEEWNPLTNATLGEDYTLEYMTTGDLAGYTVLTVGIAPELPGDFNGDGLVDLADYTVWRNHLGSPDEAVINSAGDGLAGVDQGDFEIWKRYFGESWGGEDSVAPSGVPEPSGVALLVLAITAVSGRIALRPRLSC